MENKIEYLLVLNGCDVSTYIKSDLTPYDVKLLTELAEKFSEASTYCCMPVMDFKPISECSKYELNRLKSEDDGNE